MKAVEFCYDCYINHFNAMYSTISLMGLWLQLSFSEKLPQKNQTEVSLTPLKSSFFNELTAVNYHIGQTAKIVPLVVSVLMRVAGLSPS